MDEAKWKEHYQTCNLRKVWVKVMTSDGEHFFFDEYNTWKEIKQYCIRNEVNVEEMHLQFRSHKCVLNIDGAEGIYLIRSVMGALGAESTNYYTVGVLKDGKVHKQMWLVPELIAEKEYIDDLENCFEEALIYNVGKKEKKANGEAQVQA